MHYSFEYRWDLSWWAGKYIQTYEWAYWWMFICSKNCEIFRRRKIIMVIKTFRSANVQQAHNEFTEYGVLRWVMMRWYNYSLHVFWSLKSIRMTRLVISFEISIVAPNTLTGGIVGNLVPFEALMGAKEDNLRLIKIQTQTIMIMSTVWRGQVQEINNSQHTIFFIFFIINIFIIFIINCCCFLHRFRTFSSILGRLLRWRILCHNCRCRSWCRSHRRLKCINFFAPSTNDQKYS